MKVFEKLGAFYLGKKVSSSTGKIGEDYLLYDSKDLTTHAVCVGMTGSGKTGLGIGLLEEAALDKIPAIIIDPKGDLCDLLLTFPDLSPEEFRPWVDQAEAERKGLSAEDYAGQLAKTWKEGLAAWGEDAERIKNLRAAVDLVIYTPANKAGIPISILNSFAAPPKEQLLDTDLVRDKILSITSGLLGLLGIAADPIKSREHILISTIIDQAWQKGENLDIASLIQQVQKPPFTKIGALDVDTFYPLKDRMALSISLNNLLASPGFQAWMEGAPLDIQQLLYSNKGKPKLSIISIAHLSDSERMFFVTLLLNEFLSWMRRQEGTSSLRALLYMDEIFGFFPPTAMPPSKLPMITLLKQARAFGVGIVLVTQNPVDLDYKGLSNCGTWFIGKLQTERDKSRVIEGLKVASNGEVDANALNRMIALTGNRIFIMRSIHEKDPIVFETRWTLSYLRGPLTLAQIASLMDKFKEAMPARTLDAAVQKRSAFETSKPNVPPGIAEFFAEIANRQQPMHFAPKVLGISKVHFVDSKNKIDVWKDICFAVPSADNGSSVNWELGTNIEGLKNQLGKNFPQGSTFEDLPSGLTQEKNYAQFAKSLAASLYQNQILTIYHSKELNLTSRVDESKEQFQTRLAQAMREKRDELVRKLREKYADKIASLREKVNRAQAKMSDRQQKLGMQRIQTWISIGTTILAALFGRKLTKGTISETGTSLRKVGQVSRDSQGATQAEEEYKNCEQQLADLEAQMNSEISSVITGDTGNIQLDSFDVHPKKSDISVEKVALVWWPR